MKSVKDLLLETAAERDRLYLEAQRLAHQNRKLQLELDAASGFDRTPPAQRHHSSYYSEKLRRHAAETKNELFSECAEELERLQKRHALDTKQIHQLAKDLDGYRALARSVNEAPDTSDSSYNP